MNYTVEAEREMLTVNAGPVRVPDERWRHRDASGHLHVVVDGGVPTVEWVVTGTYWCDSCRDEHEEGELRCRQCAEPVEPRYVMRGPESRMVPGRTEFTLRLDDGRSFRITEEQANRIYAGGEAAADEVVREFEARWIR